MLPLISLPKSGKVEMNRRQQIREKGRRNEEMWYGMSVECELIEGVAVLLSRK